MSSLITLYIHILWYDRHLVVPRVEVPGPAGEVRVDQRPVVEAVAPQGVEAERCRPAHLRQVQRLIYGRSASSVARDVC